MTAILQHSVPSYGAFCWTCSSGNRGHRRCVLSRRHATIKIFHSNRTGAQHKAPPPSSTCTLPFVPNRPLRTLSTSHTAARMLLQVVLVGGLGWVLWRIIRPFVTKSPWDAIPGPPRKSLLSGDGLSGIHIRLLLTVSIGNLEQLFDRDAWSFHDEVAQNYGPVVKINAVLGVSPIIHPRLLSPHLPGPSL